MPSGRSNSSRVAVVGASSLRGKELVQVLEDRHFPSSDIVLLDTRVPPGTLTEAAGEPTFIRALERLAAGKLRPPLENRNWKREKRKTNRG